MIGQLRAWAPIPLRLFLVALVFPGSQKLLEYGSEVEFFTGLGIPAPEIMVPLVGVLELAAAAMILFGVAGRLAAAWMVPIMLTAIATAGPNTLSVAVLVACLGIVALGTGRYSVMTDEELLAAVRARTDGAEETAMP